MKTIHQMLDEVSPKLLPLEEKKNSFLKKYRTRLKLLIVVSIVSFITMCILSVPPGIQFIELGIIALLAYSIYNQIKQRSAIKDEYVSSFKDIIMPAIFEAFNMNVEYRKDYFIPQEEFIKSELYQFQPSYYFGEDYIKGIIDKTRFELSDLTVKRKAEKDKDDLVFKGWFIIADFNKNFKGKTFLIPEVMGMQSGFLARTLMKFIPGNYELAKLEDPEFEKRFAVYTNDQIEARYILSFDLMKHLTQLTDVYARDIHISFVESKIYIGVMSYQNLFDPPFTRSSSLQSTVASIITQLRDCLNIVDILNLNTRVWTKE